MLKDMGIECWTGKHKYYAYRFGVTTLVIWMLIFPCMAFISVFKKRKELDEETNLLTIGFLYAGL